MIAVRQFLIALVIAASACATSDPPRPELVGCLDAYADVEQAAITQRTDYDLLNAALVVRVDGETVCRLFFGSYRPETRVVTASAAKWLTAGAILAVVDRGALRLDTRVGELFPEAPPATAAITVGQLLSHTSGLLWFSRCLGRPNYTLQGCATTILEGDTHFAPGTGFFYSGPPFTVAGAMAERALSKTWAQIFRITIAEPLGMTNTTYGPSPNPALSEGEVLSTVDDYAMFAQMVLDGGLSGGDRVLSPEAIRQMRRNWSAGVPIVSSPRGSTPYGLGTWLDATDASGSGTVLSSPGIGGFVPLIDYGRHMVFVFETRDDISRIWPAVTAMLQATRTAVDRER